MTLASAISISTIKNVITESIYNAGGSVTNIAIGNSAAKSLDKNTATTYNNIAIGDKAMHSLVTGASNTIVGTDALSATSGSGNVAIGMRAGSSGVPSGSGLMAKVDDCVVIGSNSNISDGARNRIAIGSGATCNENNSIQLGNNSLPMTLRCGNSGPVALQGDLMSLKMALRNVCVILNINPDEVGVPA